MKSLEGRGIQISYTKCLLLCNQAGEVLWRTQKTEAKCGEEEKNHGDKREPDERVTAQADLQSGLEEVLRLAR